MSREYKDSGIEWIGKIPKEWKCTCFKRFHNDANVGESIDKNFCSDSEDDVLFYTAGLKPIHTTYKDFPKWKYTSNNDLLLARNGTPYVYLPFPESIYSDHIIRVGIKENYIREYTRYCIQQAISFVVVDTVSIATWSISLWDKQFLPIPSLSEQQKIANYLDKVCGEVDEMVALQETMIEELKAYKQSVITEAVTKGLNPNVPMHDSGIDWIGEIPEHWEVRKIGRLFRLRDEKNYKQMEEVQLLSLYTGIGVFPHGEQEERGNKAVTVEGYKVVHKDDIVVNIILAWMGAIGVSDYDGVTSPAYDVYIPDFTKVVPHYFHYVFRTKGIAAECYKYGRGIMMMRWRTYSSEFKQISVPYPSIEEQQQIASYLDTKCSDIDSLIALKQAKIEELKEYKKSVIYEYVTGKKEVGG